MIKFLKFSKRVFAIIKPLNGRQLYLTFSLSVAQGIFQVLSVFSILPFLKVVISDDKKVDLPLPFELPDFIIQDITLYLGLLSLSLITVSSVVNFFADYYRTKFYLTSGQKIGVKLFDLYISKSFSYHLLNNSAELVKRLQNDVNVFSTLVLNGVVEIYSRSIIIFLMFILLAITAPLASFISLTVFLSLLLFFFLKFRNKSVKFASQRKAIVSKRYWLAKEALQGIKAVKISGIKHYFVSHFAKEWGKLVEMGTFVSFSSVLPRYLIEFLVFGSIISSVMILRDSQELLREIVPVFIIFVLSAYRILPSLQIVYANFNNVFSNKYILNILENDLNTANKDILYDSDSKISFQKNLSLKNISYQYSNANELAINNISYTFKKGQRIGIVGESGAGKSTLIEIITGLLKPCEGEVLFDDKPLLKDKNYNLKYTIGYVPQSPIILDTTISENIAIGVEKDAIDLERVKYCCKIAQLDAIIEATEHGYETLCGEEGNRFSGGQKQRIALARALYNNPEILILDESTSALDNATEMNFMNAIYNLPEDILIITIAHRLTTIEQCDEILVMSKGKIVDVGSYDYLSRNSDTFKILKNIKVNGN